MVTTTTHFTSRKIRPILIVLGASFKFFEQFFFSPEFPARCSTVLFIDIFGGWSISRTEKKITDGL